MRNISCNICQQIVLRKYHSSHLRQNHFNLWKAHNSGRRAKMALGKAWSLVLYPLLDEARSKGKIGFYHIAKEFGSHLGISGEECFKISKKWFEERYYPDRVKQKRIRTSLQSAWRAKIVKRDNYVCKICSKAKVNDVHHIDYDKKNCNPSNLITLCHQCHSKTNYERNYWVNYFKNHE